MSLSRDIYTDKIFLAQTRPAKNHSPKLTRNHGPVIYQKKKQKILLVNLFQCRYGQSRTNRTQLRNIEIPACSYTGSDHALYTLYTRCTPA